MSKPPIYALITPARNEAQFIELTIKSVVAQIILPAKWVIVSDGSTDGTDDIVSAYAKDHSWIELLRMPERTERHFAGKVHAFNAGYLRLRDIPYDVIASLDADISFDSEYFAYLLGKLNESPRLGLVGTPFKDGPDPIYDYRFVNVEHVSGACQVFRRQCFEAIGGYRAVKGGGIDYLAVVTARMKGWQTRTFTDKISYHHRVMGTAEHGLFQARFRYGVKDYVLGNHPLWQLFRSFYQMTKRPLFIGGAALLSGFMWGAVTGVRRQVSPELIDFVRREQMDRLKRFILRTKPPIGVQYSPDSITSA
ncbi:MAG TPA: glycosyltransferase [Candidatus Sulfotelmatobacter sp.]|nr:glycosyltransferase [Candidatus Sulfotelmatobacter sp.]